MYSKNEQLLEAVRHGYVLHAKWLIDNGATNLGAAYGVACETGSSCKSFIINTIIARASL